MDIVVGVAVGAVTEVVECLVSPLTNHITYLVHYKRNAIDFRNQMAILGEKKVDVERSVDEARKKGDVIKVVVEGWLTRVNQMQSKETELNNTLEESKGCLHGGFSRCYQVGKDAKHMIDEAKELLNEGKTFGEYVSSPSPLPPGIETLPTLDFQEYHSTKLAMNQIIEALKRDDVNMVGVYGIGGVGKTTLMKAVAKNLKNNGVFDQVVMVTVSQDPILTKIQGEFAENLGLPLKQESLSVRARLLSDRLKKEKRILVVLDDLWKQLHLVEVGIPYGNNCKVVLTTRQLRVCNQMETQFNVEVKVLSKKDPWVLFKRATGDHIENDDMLRPVAEQIIGECGGLPLAIVTIGRALRGQDQSEWEDAANQLKNSSSSPPDIEGVHEKVFCSIKLSYDFLANDATKICLLLCSMYPEDYRIYEDDLLLYVVGEGVFENTDTLMAVRKRMHTQIERLKRSCLLLDDHNYGRKGCVKMHDVIRDVSIWIASKEGHQDFVVQSGLGLTHFPEIRENLLWKCKRLSLMQNEITELPNRLDYCSQLMTLSLRDNKDLMEIADGFFQGMTSLKTLDLQGTNISSMPFSLSCLTDLRVLCISRSTSRRSDIPPLDVSLLGKLKKLEILHVHHSKVEKLPEEIGKLTNLKSLNLSGNEDLIIAPNILSRLSLLEELNLEKSFHDWQMDGLEEEDGINSNKGCCLSEVACLSALTTLNIRVSNIKCLLCETIPFRWESHLLTRFSVVFGTGMYEIHMGRLDGCSTRVLFNRVSIPPLKKSNWVRMYFLERAEGLLLRECPDGLNNVVSRSLIGDGLNNLRILDVQECHDVISIIPSDVLAILPNLEQLRVWGCRRATEVFNSKRLDQGQGQLDTLTKLKRLNLRDLPCLRTIWEGVVSPLSLLNLEEIILFDLRLMKFTFSLAMAQRLQQLKELIIEECPEMVEIISSSSIDTDENTEYAGLGSSSSSTLLEEEDHHDHLNFETNNYSSSSLLPTPPIFGNLTKLEINNCKSLEHILPMSLAQGLPQLEELEIEDCPNLKEIIFVKDDEDDDDNIIIEEKDEAIMCSKTKTSTPPLFPRLRYLSLWDLPNLSTVINSSKGLYDYYWPSLETLRVDECRNLKRLPLSLTSLQNPSATKLREIWVEKEYWLNGLEWDDDQTTPDNYLQLLRQRGVKVTFLS